MAAVADIVSKVQGGEAPTADEFAEVQAAVENPEVPVNVRVRCLPVLANHLEVNQSLLSKVVASFVKMLDDDMPVVHNAVVSAFTALCTSATKFLDANKTSELVRDATDVLFQISLHNSGFSEDVRKAARAAVQATLPGVSVLGVAIKAVHLLCNDRWNDEAEQLSLERKRALDLLVDLVGPKALPLWNEESETKLLKTTTPLFAAASAQEMRRVLQALGKLPGVAEKEGTPLVDAVLKLKMDTPRGIESLQMLRACMKKETVNDAIIDKLAPLVTKAKPADAYATELAKAFLFATRHASAEKAAKHLGTVKSVLAKDKGDSWSFSEALMASLGTLGAKAPETIAEMLEDDEFRRVVYARAEAAAAVELNLEFASQKAAVNAEASPKNGEAVECLKHIIRMGAFVDVKKAPAVEMCSWETRARAPKAPAQKRVDIDAPLQQAKKAQPEKK